MLSHHKWIFRKKWRCAILIRSAFFIFSISSHMEKLLFWLLSRFFRSRVFLFSGFSRNHFVTRIDRHNHAEKRTASKIFMSWFHILVAGVASSDHGNQCTDRPVFMWFHLNLLSFIISYIFLRNMQTGIFKLVFANNLWTFTVNYNSLTVVNWA